MAARSLGTLTIDLVAKIGGFTRGMTEAERVADRASRDIARKQRQRAQEVERAWATAVRSVGLAVAGVAAAAGAAFAALNRQIENVASFKDIEEETGGSAEGMASLAVAAETAGVGMDAVSGIAIKLTKNLTGVDDESKAAGAAIRALGLDIDEFKRLAPPERFDAIAKALAGFADGPEKTAVAFALAGKQGAELLKLSKALQEQGGRTTILTQRQIELADEYADKQARSTAELKLYAQAAATEALPALSALVEETKKFFGELVGIDKATGQLKANSAVREFAEGAAVTLAVLVEASVGVIKAVALIPSAFSAAYSDIKALEAKIAQASPFAKLVGSLAGVDFEKNLKDRNEKVAAFNKQLKDLIEYDGAAISNALKKQFADLRNGLTGERLDAFNDPRSTLFGAERRDLAAKPRLNFDGAIKDAKKAKESVDEVAKALAEVQEHLALFDQDDTFTKAFKIEGLGATTEQVREYRDALSRLEELKADQAIRKTIDELVKQRDEIGLTNEQLTIHRLVLQGASADQIQYAQSVLAAASAAKEQQAALEEGKRLYDETRTPAEQLNIRLGKLNDLLQKGAIDWDTYARAVFKAQDDFDNATKKTTETVDSFSKRFAENTQDFFGQGLYDLMTGNFKNIGDAFANMVTRMIAEAAAADLAKYLFGDLIKGGSGGGLLGGLFSGITGLLGFANGGNPPVGVASLVGEEGPELFVPRTAGTIVPASETASLLRGGGGMTVTQNFTINGPADRRTQEQIASAAARGVQLATMRGTA